MAFHVENTVIRLFLFQNKALLKCQFLMWNPFKHFIFVTRQNIS